jgi:hypothetical protein
MTKLVYELLRTGARHGLQTMCMVMEWRPTIIERI